MAVARRHGRRRHAASSQWRPQSGRGEPRTHQSDPCQHGAVALAAARPRPVYVTVNIPEFMLRVVEEGTPIHTTARRRWQARQADAGDLRRDGGSRLQPLLECPTPSRWGDRALYGVWWRLLWRLAIPRCLSVTGCASNMAAATSTPIRSIGAATIFATSISSSLQDPTTCLAA